MVVSWRSISVASFVPRTSYHDEMSVDQKLSSTVVVRNSVVDVTLWNSNSRFYQFGRKADEPGDGWPLDADVHNLRIFGSALAP